MHIGLKRNSQWRSWGALFCERIDFLATATPDAAGWRLPGAKRYKNCREHLVDGIELPAELYASLVRLWETPAADRALSR